jgi:ElaB/YqjD/DUF883 family membrane-anchored ribosome-binding protein
MDKSISLRLQIATADLGEVVQQTGLPALNRLELIRRNVSQAIDMFREQLVREKLLTMKEVKIRNKKTGKDVLKTVYETVG